MGCARHRRVLVFSVAALIFLPSTLFVQQTPAPQGTAASAQSAPAPEIATQESQPGFTLKARTTEVLVRVVVRDAKGRAVSDLHQEDFEITDNRKPQKITGFSVEAHPGATAAPGQPATAPPAKGAQRQAAPSPPTAYLVLFFDDLSSAFESVARTRKAAEEFIAGVPPTERIAVFASSGNPFLDFTADRQKLHEALSKLRSNVRGGAGPACPEITDFVADRIVNFEDREAITLVRDEAINDCRMDPRMVGDMQIRAWAQMAYGAFQIQARAVLENLERAVQYVARRPGERQLMLVSDGFMTFDWHDRLERVIDEALHLRVIVSSLDGKGLAVLLRVADASRSGPLTGNLSALYTSYDTGRQVADTATLEEMANGTGGQFVHDTNDLLGGFQRALTPPETDYILTFSPENLKADGAFHTLKVSLKNGHGFSVQARKGYFAPSAAPATELAATGGIQEAVPVAPPAPPAAPATELAATGGIQEAVPVAPPAPPAAPPAAPPEIATQETQPGFALRARANEVLVRAVVRDAQGKGVANLTKDDFRLLDNGKAQTIREFSVEVAGGTAVAPAAPPNVAGVGKVPEEAKPAPAAVAARFVALYFDDTFISFDGLARTRLAATHYLHTSLTPGDRVGLFTSSGQGNVDFTNDLAALENALDKLRMHPSGAMETSSDCLNFSVYESYLMSEQEDPQALALGKEIVVNCLCGGGVPSTPNTPANVVINPCNFDPTTYATSTARGIWQRSRFATEQCLRGLAALVRRMGVMPGQRSIVWISPGFLNMENEMGLSSVIDQALRARVVISALDSRGLWVLPPGGDASQQGAGLSSARFSAEHAQYAHTEQQLDADVMANAASGTGGVFFQNSNDFDAGFRMVGGLPEVAYLLSFSPENLKYDGKYHKLSVQLANGRGLNVQARRGYFAPSGQIDSERVIKEDMQEAVFSPEERKDLPLEVQTQFFMATRTDGQLSVVARLDLHGARLHKEQQRNVDELRFIAALFDDNGNLLEGQEKIVSLHLQDTTLGRLLATGGLKVGWHFKVKPGTYVVREVVRDSGSGGIAALSRTVEIPYSN